MVSSQWCSFVAGLVTANDEQLGWGELALPACLPQLSSLKKREVQSVKAVKRSVCLSSGAGQCQSATEVCSAPHGSNLLIID